MSSHTPAPWNWDTDFQGLFNMDIPETILDFEPWEGMRLEYHKDQGRREANARLMAASPDLLNALQACSKELRAMIDFHNVQSLDDGSYTYDYQTVFEADQAIAKALASNN